MIVPWIMNAKMSTLPSCQWIVLVSNASMWAWWVKERAWVEKISSHPSFTLEFLELSGMILWYHYCDRVKLHPSLVFFFYFSWECIRALEWPPKICCARQIILPLPVRLFRMSGWITLLLSLLILYSFPPYHSSEMNDNANKPRVGVGLHHLVQWQTTQTEIQQIGINCKTRNTSSIKISPHFELHMEAVLENILGK